MRAYSVALALLLGLVAINSTKQDANGCRGSINNAPVLEIEPVLTGEVKNGKSWKIDDGHGNYIYVAKVSGSAYEMGYAYGQLYGQEVMNNINGMVNYYMNQVTNLLRKYGVPELIA